MELNKTSLSILITGGILSVICTGIAYAGALYIYEMANPIAIHSDGTVEIG